MQRGESGEPRANAHSQSDRESSHCCSTTLAQRSAHTIISVAPTQPRACTHRRLLCCLAPPVCIAQPDPLDSMLLQLTRQNVQGEEEGKAQTGGLEPAPSAAAASSSSPAAAALQMPPLSPSILSSLPGASALLHPYPLDPSAASMLPHNPLASLVGANLQEWMDEGEDDEDDESDDEEFEHEDEATAAAPASAADIAAAAAKASEATPMTDTQEGKEEQEARAAAAADPRRAARPIEPIAPSAAAAASSSAAAAAAASPAAPSRRRAKRKTHDNLMADDSAEMREIMGAGYGGGAGASGSGSGGGVKATARGKAMLLRRGTRRGKLSQLTPDLERRMGEANSAYISNDFAKAVDILLHIIQSAPHALGPYHTLGLIYEERGEIQKAIEAYMLAAHMSRRDYALWKRVGKMAYDAGQLEHATYCWTKVLLSETDNHELRMDRSLAYFELKDYRRALDGFQYLLKRTPNDPALLRQAASCCSHMQRPQSGVVMLVSYLDWFKTTVERNEKRDQSESAEEVDARRAKRHRLESGAPAPGDIDVAEDLQPQVTGGLPPSLLVASDLDVNLVNILCELYLSLHKFQEVVDTLEDLMPSLLASVRRDMGAPEGAVVELPFDLHSKLGIAYLYLSEFALADEIFAPLLSKDPAQNQYEVESWADLYYDVAEAYVNNRRYPQAERLCEQLVTVREWNNSLTWHLQAKCAHYQAVTQLQTGPAQSTDSSNADLLRHAQSLYERVHAEENGENVDVRLALSELYHIFGQAAEAKEILRGIDIEAHQVATTLGMQPSGRAGAKGDTAFSKLKAAAQPTATFFKHQEELRIFSHSCELLLQQARAAAATPVPGVDPMADFLRLALPVLVNIISVAVLAVEDDDEPMPHEKMVPRADVNQKLTSSINGATVAAASAAAATAAPTAAPAAPMLNPPRFLDLPVDKAHSFNAQRLLLSFEFLRPCFAAIKALYTADRLSECLWLIHHLDRVLLRYSHSAAAQVVPTIKPTGPGSIGFGGMLSSPISETSLAEHVKSLMLGLKYLSAGLFLRLGDSERAYRCLRVPLSLNPYSFPLAHIMNGILNAQSYPGKAIKTMERLFDKHPSSLPLAMLLGHGCLVHQNYETAMVYYLRLHSALPPSPLLMLLLGVTKLQLALKKTNRFRHHDLLVAFSFLFQYKELALQRAGKGVGAGVAARSVPVLQAEQEACYNLGRAFQYVGLFYMARPEYERVLAIAGMKRNVPEATPDAAAASSAAASAIAASKAAVPPSSLHAEAAHNLAIIYTQTGSPELARRLYAQYCRV